MLHLLDHIGGLAVAFRWAADKDLDQDLGAPADGDAANLWNDGADFAAVEKRVRKLPGFGKEKAQKLRYVLHYFGHRDFSGE